MMDLHKPLDRYDNHPHTVVKIKKVVVQHINYVVLVIFLFLLVVIVPKSFVGCASTCEPTDSNLLTTLKLLSANFEMLNNRLQFLESSLHTLRNTAVNSDRNEEKEFRGRKKRSEKSVESQLYRNEFNRSMNIVNLETVQFACNNPVSFSNRTRGILGPWVEHPYNGHDLNLLGIKLIEKNRKVEVSRKGLYFIYAQVTYLSRSSAVSYSINVISGPQKTSTPISVCNSVGKYLIDGEVSCYTSVIRLLNSGDVVYLQQISLDSEINAYETFTHFGLILLSTSIANPTTFGNVGSGIFIIAALLVFIAFFSRSWLVSNYRFKGATFNRLGLRYHCFRTLPDQHDDYSYRFLAGCRWIYDPFTPGYDQIRGYLAPTFMFLTQFFYSVTFIIVIVCIVGVIRFLSCCSPDRKLYMSLILSLGCTLVVASLSAALACIIFGFWANQDDWMPGHDNNYFGWSYIVAVISILVLLASGILFLGEARI